MPLRQHFILQNEQSYTTIVLCKCALKVWQSHCFGFSIIGLTLAGKHLPFILFWVQRCTVPIDNLLLWCWSPTAQAAPIVILEFCHCMIMGMFESDLL